MARASVTNTVVATELPRSENDAFPQHPTRPNKKRTKRPNKARGETFGVSKLLDEKRKQRLLIFYDACTFVCSHNDI